MKFFNQEMYCFVANRGDKSKIGERLELAGLMPYGRENLIYLKTIQKVF